ncbi:hypothetical protein F5B22DRAFT_47454 [Xylaria bambusicola]|uniref:uncharacterized protein n=1 Tax=Xylaria bambusicola TaxID=326684 RepID=UPI002007A044|nr:uncharacterized protein F5B22DRAFT_47454 [Xylaria bambusicola]KAI0520690.1 hypothetical protein F5B22DRAFT_47454 [Xylaria bambusicola]
MARTRAQIAAQKGLSSPAPKHQGKRGHLQEQRATKRTERNCPRPSIANETLSHKDPPAPVQSRGRKRKQSVDALEPSPDPAQKRQRASSTPLAKDAFGELLSRKREIDNPAESNLPQAKRVRRAKAREHTLQEQAGSDHAEFHLYPTGRGLHRENLTVSIEREGQKQLRAVEDLLEHTSDESSRKRPRTSLGQQEAASGDTEDWRDIIDFWRREGYWPKKYFEQDDYIRKDFEKESEDSWLKEMERYDPTVRLLFAKKKAPTSLRRKRSGSNSSTTPSQDTIPASSMTPSDQKPREEKSAPYRDAKYILVLKTQGVFMEKSELGVTDASKQLCRNLLDFDQAVPSGTLFGDDVFENACRDLEGRNEAKIIQDISRLLVPSAQAFAIFGAKHLKRLVESVNEGWNNSMPLTGTRPQPDYSVGFRREAFTDDQLTKLSPFIGDFIVGDQCLFMATYYMYFPFLTCEVKCGAAALDIADRQNAHSMTLAVRAIVELFRAVKLEGEVHRQILAFSISHDHRSVRIYGHYPVITGKDTKYYRHPIRTFDFTELDGKDKWTAYRFTKNVYDTWMPAHFKKICSAIDKLPNLDFDVPSLSEATGLSQDLGNLMQSDAGAASVPVEGDSQLSIAEQHAVTPDTSFTRSDVAKRRKG